MSRATGRGDFARRCHRPLCCDHLSALHAASRLYDRDAQGRSLALHSQEALLQGLRAAQHQPAGRARLRERTTVEHSLARIDQIQGTTARYKGVRENTSTSAASPSWPISSGLARLPQAA